MKVAALSPQFIVESPISSETSEAEKVTRDLHLKVVSTPSAQGADANNKSTDEQKKNQNLDLETLDGLKRLSMLIHNKKLEGITGKPFQHIKGIHDQKRRKAIALYRNVARGGDSRDFVGHKFDDFV